MSVTKPKYNLQQKVTRVRFAAWCQGLNLQIKLHGAAMVASVFWETVSKAIDQDVKRLLDDGIDVGDDFTDVYLTQTNDNKPVLDLLDQLGSTYDYFRDYVRNCSADSLNQHRGARS